MGPNWIICCVEVFITIRKENVAGLDEGIEAVHVAIEVISCICNRYSSMHTALESVRR